jgi:hypothetical protein
VSGVLGDTDLGCKGMLITESSMNVHSTIQLQR